jgi:DUF1365 family protein
MVRVRSVQNMASTLTRSYLACIDVSVRDGIDDWVVRLIRCRWRLRNASIRDHGQQARGTLSAPLSRTLRGPGGLGGTGSARGSGKDVAYPGRIMKFRA